MGRRGTVIATALWFAALMAATIWTFGYLDARSHSASDTLRPFVIATVPAWIVSITVARILLRRDRETPARDACDSVTHSPEKRS